MDLKHVFAVVTTSIDGDVLARLAQADQAFTAGQLHRILPEVSPDGIRRSLRRLAEQGIVEAIPVGLQAITYGLNRDHVAADAIIALAKTPATVQRRIQEELATWRVPPVYGAVFGSWARREAGVGSDLDLFLVRPDDADEPAWETQVARIEHLATRWTGNDTRALVLTHRHVIEHPDDPVLTAIVNDGLTVAGAASWLRRAITGTRRTV
jgi:hypothetical protein